MLKAVRKRTKQLPTLLRACWQWSANGCNNSQQCWDLQCIVGRIQTISVCNERAWPQQCWKSCVNGSNIVALCFCDYGTKEMLGVVGWKFWPVSNFGQQHAIACNRVCKRAQHVTSNSVGSCWSTKLRPFACSLRGLKSWPWLLSGAVTSRLVDLSNYFIRCLLLFCFVFFFWFHEAERA